jgi:hypothetical protein
MIREIPPFSKVYKIYCKRSSSGGSRYNGHIPRIGGIRMTTAAMKGEETMTDYQFKTIIKMVLAIARKTKDASAIIKELEKLLPENERETEEE